MTGWPIHHDKCLSADNSQVKGYVCHCMCSHLLSSSITKSKLRMYIGHFRLLFGFRIWGVWSPANVRMTLSPSILFLCYFRHITHTCSQKYKSSCTCGTHTHTLSLFVTPGDQLQTRSVSSDKRMWAIVTSPAGSDYHSVRPLLQHTGCFVVV